ALLAVQGGQGLVLRFVDLAFLAPLLEAPGGEVVGLEELAPVGGGPAAGALRLLTGEGVVADRTGGGRGGGGHARASRERNVNRAAGATGVASVRPSARLRYP